MRVIFEIWVVRSLLKARAFLELKEEGDFTSQIVILRWLALGWSAGGEFWVEEAPPPPQGSPLYIEMRHPFFFTMHTVAIHFIVALSVVSMCVTGEDCLDSVFDNSISHSLSICKTGPLIANFASHCIVCVANSNRLFVSEILCLIHFYAAESVGCWDDI